MIFRLNPSSDLPIYHQIAEQVRHAVASGRIAPGWRLPTVRQLAKDLGVHVNTVARAYADLEREGVLTSRQGRGTFVRASREDEQMVAERETRLQGIVGRAVLEALSLGYTPDQLEAVFALRLTRWRDAAQGVGTKADQTVLPSDSITIVGSHDLTLDLLAGQLRRRTTPCQMTLANVGSLAGLIALARNEAHLAGCHLLDEETGEYNLPYVKRLLPGQGVVLVNLVHRIQGLMVSKGNPKKLFALSDLARTGITFVNRQPGSGTRVLLDYKLREARIAASSIQGYGHEETTHLGVAAVVLEGAADTGFGILAAARAMELDFVPLWRERYDLVVPRQNYDAPLLRPLLETIRGDEFRRVVQELGGYDTSMTGRVVSEMW